jgi:hypothetical protein
MTLADRSPTPDAAELTPRSRWHGARMTLEKFLALPEEEASLEFDGGLVTQKVASQADHGSIQGELFLRFDQGWPSTATWKGVHRDAVCDAELGARAGHLLLPPRAHQATVSPPDR